MVFTHSNDASKLRGVCICQMLGTQLVFKRDFSGQPKSKGPMPWLAHVWHSDGLSMTPEIWTMPGVDPLPVIQLHQTTNDFGVIRGGGSPGRADIEFPTQLELRTDSNLIERNIQNVIFLEPKYWGGCKCIPAMSAYLIISNSLGTDLFVLLFFWGERRKKNTDLSISF